MKSTTTLLFFLLLLSSCKKEGGSSQYYFKATINGEAIQWTCKKSGGGDYEAACPTLSGSLPFFNCLPGEPMYQGLEGTSIAKRQEGIIDSSDITIGFVRSYDFGVPSSTEIMSRFIDGPKTFGIKRFSCSDPVVDGVVISYIDARGHQWESSLGDQSAGILEQVSLTKNTGPGYNSKDWKVRFSCKLYDRTGNSITVTNGEVYGPVFMP